MHDTGSSSRLGADAFQLRDDVTVADAFETAALLLRGVIASIELIELSGGGSRLHRDACSACATLVRQVGGAVAVIEAAAMQIDDKGTKR
jgi:hypothetical protein